MVARGWEKVGWKLFNGYTVSVLQDEKNSGDLCHNNVNVLNTAELYTKIDYDGKLYIMCVLPHLKKHKNALFFSTNFLICHGVYRF